MSRSLDTKHRPNTLEEIIGNKESIESIKSILNRPMGERPHSYLLFGPSGCGKTTLSRILAKALGAEDREISEVNTSDQRGIDTARFIISTASFAPIVGRSKVWILNEAHKATNEYQNAMLEILEEPPVHAYFILVTTEPEKLLTTVKNRCRQVKMQRLLSREMKKLLEKVCEVEGVSLPEDLMKSIISTAEGTPRTALVLLDQIMDLGDIDTALKVIESSSIEHPQLINICRTLLNGKVEWKSIASTLASLDLEPEQCRYGILKYMSTVVLNSPNERAVKIIDIFSEPFINSGRAGLVAACYWATKV